MKRMSVPMLVLALALCLAAPALAAEAAEPTPGPAVTPVSLSTTPVPHSTPGPAATPVPLTATPVPHSTTPTPAPTAPGTIFTVLQGYTWSFDNVVPVGDTVYEMTASGQRAQLWRWQEDMAHAEQFAPEQIYAPRFTSLEAASVAQQISSSADAVHALDRLFTDGEKLYGYNSLNKLVFAIDVTEDGLEYTDLAQLTFLEDGAYNQPITLLKAGDWLLWYEADRNSLRYSERLLAFNLVTGAVKQAVMPEMVAVSSYKEGQVLVLCEADDTQMGSYAVYAYDPRTDLSQCLGTLPKNLTTRLRCIAYSPALDMLVYQDQTRIMGWTAASGAEQLGFIPTTIRESIAVMGDTLLYSAEGTDVRMAPLQRGYATGHSLTLLGGSMNEVLSRFYMRYMDVPVYSTNLMKNEDYLMAFTRTEDMPDMAYISATGSQYQALLDGGYLLDLSAYPDLMAYADKLYPVWRELVEKDGGIYALPVTASSYNGWFINKEVMTAMGLTEADIPTSLTELCAFASKWNDEYADKFPQYTLLNNTTGYRGRLLEAILTAWQDCCAASGKPLTADDPLLLEALTALENARLDKLDEALKQTDPEVSEYKQALIWTGCKVVGNWASYMEDYSDRIFIPLTLTEDTPYVAAVNSVSLWVINANSANADYAAALLAESLTKQAEKSAYVMRSDLTEPILNDGYAETLAYEQSVLASLEAKLEDSVNKAAMERRIDEQKAYIEVELARTKYEINPKAIENYVNVIMPAAVVQESFPGNGQAEQYANLVCDYNAKALTMEEFITQFDALLKEAK